MDNCAIVTDAPNLDSGLHLHQLHARPAELGRSISSSTGTTPRIKDIEALLPADLPFKDLIFFTPEQVGTMEAGEVNEAQERLVDIYNKAKAEAGA